MGREAVLVVQNPDGRLVELGLGALIDKATGPMARILDPKFQNIAEDVNRAGNRCVYGKLTEQGVEETATQVLFNPRLIVSHLHYWCKLQKSEDPKEVHVLVLPEFFLGLSLVSKLENSPLGIVAPVCD